MQPDDIRRLEEIDHVPITEQRARLAEDAQAKRYSNEVLLAMMEALQPTASNSEPVYPDNMTITCAYP